MSMLKTAFVVALLAVTGSAAAQGYGIGRKVAEGDLAPWNIDVAPDGANLPKGSGTVAQGKTIYDAQCAACHGLKGEGKPADRLVGGQGTLKSDRPVKTIGSFWPYATTIYDYINRAMPYTAPQSLSPDQVYAVTAYLLHLNGIVGADATLDAASLPKIAMPNRGGFTPDVRPDVNGIPCRVDCR